jgi:hypothetical protein
MGEYRTLAAVLHCRRHPESFDNSRACPPRLLAELSEHGQVIYSTHHEHLCDIARGVCPSVNIYNLEQMAPAAVVN